jgi:hypothetical protein
VNKIIKQRDITYKDKIILSYTIKYPEFSLSVEQEGKIQKDLGYLCDTELKQFLNQLNMFYKIKTTMYEKNNIRTLYRMAIDDYENSMANGYPVRKYEAYTDYNVTYNKNCLLSLYFDQYEYTGGAHGITNRTTDSWDLKRKKRIELADLFPNTPNYSEYIKGNIIKQIEDSIASGNNIYFEDYKKLVNEYFNVNNFYFNDKGIVIFFPQYDIAPYAAGMPTFTIPYTEGGATLPF